MKKFILSIILLAGVFAASCDEDSTTPANNPQTMNGKWHLVDISGSIAGGHHALEPGTITWAFGDDGLLVVQNNNTNESIEDFFESGTYTYSYIPNEDSPEMCAQVLMVNSINLGCQVGNAQEMIITNTWADGYQLKFIYIE